MRVNITGINFQYKNGYDQDYTGVELSFITSGFKFTNNDPVHITKDQYEANKGNSDALRVLVVDKILSDVNDYVGELEDYKNSLTDTE